MGNWQSSVFSIVPFSSTTKPKPKPHKASAATGFVMPLHYPRYTLEDYKEMPEAVLDCLLSSYGIPLRGDVEDKREEAIGHFLWPSQRVPKPKP